MEEQVQKTTKKVVKKDYIYATGRRKTAVARVRLYEKTKEGLVWGELAIKKGDMVVNGKAIADYFGGDVNKYLYSQPLRITNVAQQNYTFTIRVVGGGPAGQLQAVVAGIANALNKLDREKHRPILKKKGLLTRDDRARQRRKVGMGGKSRRKKQSPKR
ncbi:MAG TPA: 30S ribosomal protein S9 [Patescibacteria group bacterium]|nr:30S ribosomal protein S9 [Patescibacteria group bacterium]